MDVQWYRTSRHESAHAASAMLLDIPINRVTRVPTCGADGSTTIHPLHGSDSVQERAMKVAVFYLSPAILLDFEGCASDVLNARALDDAGLIRMDEALARTERLVWSNDHADLRRRIYDRLLQKPVLQPGDLRALR